MLKEVELPFGNKIYQLKNGQSITSDSTQLLDFIRNRNQQKQLDVLELGSGNGIILIMLSHYFPNWKLTGIEIQKELVELSIKNSEISKKKIDFQKADLKEYRKPAKFDIIISNPPYYAKNQGKISPIKTRAISRHEILCSMYDIFFNIKENLKPKGKAYLIYPALRMDEINKTLKKVDLRITEILIINMNMKSEKIAMELVHA